MRGLDALAATCEPQQTDPTAAPAAVILTEEQMDKIVNKMIEKLQQPEQPAADPDPEPEDQTDPIEEVEENDGSADS